MMPEKIEDCRNCADLIRLYLKVRTPVPEDPSLLKDYNPKPEEIVVEDAVAAALAHYGPMIWEGYIWWEAFPPRDRRLNRVRFSLPKDCPWPISQPTPEGKTAGYISHQWW